MLPNYVKISQFTNGGSQAIDDIVTGLRGGTNTNFIGTVPSGVLGWKKEITNITMLSNYGYLPQSASTLTFTLPTTCVFGDYIRVAGAYFSNNVPWIIQCGGAQIIYDNTVVTDIGGSGTVTATTKTASIELLCVADNTAFQVLSSNGNLLFA